MKRIIAITLCLLMLVCVLPLNAFATTTALKNKTVIAFGDSLTALGNPTYVGYLSDLLGITVVNAGVGGNMTAHGRARFETDVLSKNPDVVLLCFGMNDQACSLPSGQSWTSIETYRIDMGYFITELQKIGCEVVLITPNPVCDESGYYVAPAEGTYTYNYPGSLDKFCTAMRELALEYGCTLVDMNQEFKLVKASNIATFKSYYATGDGIHQSQLGRQFWAEKVNAHLNAIYDNVNKSTITVKCVDESNGVLKTFSYVGAKDANIVIAPPVLTAFSTKDSAVTAKFSSTATTVTFKYSAIITPLLTKVDALDESKYTATTLALIKEEYNKAKALLSADVIDFDALEKCAKNLEYYLSVTGEATVVISMGSSYTRPEPNYYKWDSATGGPSTELNEMYSDDYIRLTDGVKSTIPANSSAYSAWQSDATIVVDLGSEVESNIYRGYFASGQWGVATPAKMNIYYSNDKTTWTAIEKTAAKTVIVDGGSDGWSSTEYAVTLDEAISARYIKFEILKTGSFVWVDEIEVAVGKSVEPNLNLAYGKEYEKSPLFRQSNITWDWDETFPIAYPDENDVTLTDGVISTANDLNDAAWVGFNAKTPASAEKGYNFIKVDLGAVYGLTELSLHVGSNGLGYGITAPSVEFFVSEDGVTYTSVGSAKGVNDGKTSETLLVKCEANARYIEARITGAGWEFVSEIFAYGGEAFGSTEPNPDPNPDHTHTPADTWSTDKNNHWKECACGEDMNKAAHTAGDWEVVTPATLEKAGEQVKKCTVCQYVLETKEIPQLTPDHTHSEVGGWTSDKDNHWNECSCGEDLNKAPHTAGDWVVVTPATVGRAGEEVKKCTVCEYILETKEIPALEEEKPDPTPDTEFMIGDVNDSKEIDSMDYVLVKRAYFGTFEFNEAQLKAADVNASGDIDSMDYVLIKRAYFGTFSFQ